MNGSNGATSGGFFANLAGLTQSQGFWELAFLVALVLLIGAHKITIEGLVEA
jgi:hypothetical protein